MNAIAEPASARLRSDGRFQLSSLDYRSGGRSPMHVRRQRERSRVSKIVSPLCQADGGWNVVGVVKEVVDAADEVAFEVADRFLFGLAVGALLSEVEGGARVVAEPDDCEDVKGAVEPTVAAGV
jgi:hypothetical protein